MIQLLQLYRRCSVLLYSCSEYALNSKVKSSSSKTPTWSTVTRYQIRTEATPGFYCFNNIYYLWCFFNSVNDNKQNLTKTSQVRPRLHTVSLCTRIVLNSRRETRQKATHI